MKKFYLSKTKSEHVCKGALIPCKTDITRLKTKFSPESCRHTLGRACNACGSTKSRLLTTTSCSNYFIFTLIIDKLIIL